MHQQIQDNSDSQLLQKKAAFSYEQTQQSVDYHTAAMKVPNNPKIYYFYFLLVYAGAILINQTSADILITRAQQERGYYGHDATYFNAYQYLNIVNAAACLPAVYTIEKIGFKWSAIITYVFQTISLWLTYYYKQNFNLILGMLFLMTFFTPFLYFSILKFSSTYFSGRWRVFSTAVILIFYIQGQFMQPEVSYHSDASHFDRLNFIFAILTSVMLGLLFTLMMPTVMISKTQDYYLIEDFSILKELRACLDDSNFLHVTIASSIILGTVKAFNQVLVTIYTITFWEKYPGKQFIYTYIVPYATMVGILSYVFISKFKTHTFWVRIIGLAIIFAMLVLFIESLVDAHNYNFYIYWNIPFSVLLGALMMSVTELQAEVAFPIRLGVSYGLFFTAFGLLWFFIGDYFYNYYETMEEFTKLFTSGSEPDSVPLICSLSIAMIFFSLVIYHFGDTNYKRTEYEKRTSK